MAKDHRLFAKFALDFPGSPKIKPLSDAAFRCLVEATIWSREHETDGFLATRLACASWSLETLRELCTNDDVKPSLIERDEGWYIRDFDRHQDTKVEIDARRERARTAGQKGGLTKAKRPAKRPAKRQASGLLSKNVAETETEVVTNVTTNPPVAPPTRGTRLPDDWTPNPEVVAQMRSEHPRINLDAEHAKFVDYWHAKAGRDARKANWDATWRNWVRRAAEQHARAPTRNSSTADRRVADTQALKTSHSTELP